MLEALVQLFLIVLVFWWWASFVASKLIPAPGPTLRRWLRHALRSLRRTTWRRGFRNQYDRRGLLHACAHALTIVMIVATLCAVINLIAYSWSTLVFWWGITFVCWFILIQRQRLQERKRRLPSRRERSTTYR